MFDRVLNTVKNIALKKAARKLVIGSRSSFLNVRPFGKNTKCKTLWEYPILQNSAMK